MRISTRSGSGIAVDVRRAILSQIARGYFIVSAIIKTIAADGVILCLAEILKHFGASPAQIIDVIPPPEICQDECGQDADDGNNHQ